MSEPPVQAAGAVVWRLAGERIEVLVVHRQRYDDWSFPKGKVDPGEHHVAAAVREVHEETGVEIRLGPQLTRHRYLQRRSDGAAKEVTYWAARPIDGTGTAAEAHQPNDEVDRVRWLDVHAAGTTLTYERDVAVLEHFGRLVAGLGHHSEPLVVLRHGAALARKRWPSDDRDRPLDDTGAAQARRLVPLLRAFGIDTVLSSDARRCVQTVWPYVEATGLAVVRDPRWSEEQADPESVDTAITELREDASCAVLCTHRPVLPWVLASLGLPARKLRPGTALVVHRVKGDAVGTELLAP